MFRNLFSRIFIFTALTFYSCTDDKPQGNALKLIPQEILPGLSKGWIIDQSQCRNGEYFFKKKNRANIKTGEVFHLEFANGKYLDFFELNSDSLNPLEYKLYVNEQLIGKYSSNSKIGTKRLVKSLKLIITKTGNERIVRGWDKTFNYLYVKDTSNVNNLKQNFILKLPIKQSTFLVPEITPNKWKSSPDLYKDLLNNPNIIVTKNKKTNETTEQSINFRNDGSFYINYTKKQKSGNKIISNYHVAGKWKIVKVIGSNTKIKLNGFFSGKLDAKSSYNIIPYKQEVIIDSLKIIRSRDFLDGVMLDLPNWVMVNLRHFNNDFIIDIPYSTENNIAKTKMYDCNECYLLYTTVKDLLKIQETFRQMGLRVKMLDCYRPQYVQQILYDACPMPGYVADPIGGSIHNRGTAVDLTLVDKDGKELNMGTPYDDLSVKSNHGYIGFPDTVLKNRALLLRTMKANNFVPIRIEWWHYNLINARRYPKLNDKFPCN